MNFRAPAKHTQYALSSLACPFLALVAAHIYQRIAHTEFWHQVSTNMQDDANRHAAVLMALAEVTSLFYFLLVGSVVGLLLAIMNLKKYGQLGGIGLLALIINSIPLAPAILVAVRATIYN